MTASEAFVFMEKCDRITEGAKLRFAVLGKRQMLQIERCLNIYELYTVRVGALRVFLQNSTHVFLKYHFFVETY